MATVYIGVGSNLGRRKENCLKALKLLAGKDVTIKRRSSFYETEPWGVTEQPRFINMAVEAETALPPRELLMLLKDIEKRLGRVEGARWGPRVIDLDILLYDGLVMREPGLEIPHRLMHERDFALAPLSEIAPGLIHPVLGKSIEELKRDLKKG
jgi:2-amino-4-hydroxy-6-hydroxymethyldihydropteridine diphosphokinase